MMETRSKKQKRQRLTSMSSQKEEHLLGRAFAHIPSGRTELRLGSVVQVRNYDGNMILDVMYTDSDETIENVEYHKRANNNDPIETSFDVATFAEIVEKSTKSQLDDLCNPHTEIIDVDGRYYAVDRDVFDATKPLFCLVVGKVPSPECVRGRFWNCHQGRMWKCAVMGKAKLGGSWKREKMDNCEVEKAILPWHEETYLGRGVFQDKWLTDHGWACTDISQKPRRFKSDPTQSEIEKGWGRINDEILKHQKPKVLFFVYKAVLDWLLSKVYKLTSVKSKYGLNDHLDESIRNEHFAGAHIFVFPMPGTGWAKNRQSKMPFCDRDAEMSKLYELRKQWMEV